MAYRQRVGKWGEDQALAYLSSKGLCLIGRNVRTAHGEIDLIMADGEQLVFVEVKTRTSLDFGNPEESITSKKRARMVASVESYLQKSPENYQEWRIDVIAIYGMAGDSAPEIEWFENAVT